MPDRFGAGQHQGEGYPAALETTTQRRCRGAPFLGRAFRRHRAPRGKPSGDRAQPRAQPVRLKHDLILAIEAADGRHLFRSRWMQCTEQQQCPTPVCRSSDRPRLQSRRLQWQRQIHPSPRYAGLLGACQRRSDPLCLGRECDRKGLRSRQSRLAPAFLIAFPAIVRTGNPLRRRQPPDPASLH